MKRKEIVQDSTDIANVANKGFDEYRDMITFRQKPVSDRYIQNVAQNLVQWALNDEDALKISQFFHKKGISSSAIQRWMERSPMLKEAYEFALSVIGDRREIGALKRKLDAGMVASSMAHYDHDWKKLAEWKASLKCKEEHGQGRTEFIVVEVPPLY